MSQNIPTEAHNLSPEPEKSDNNFLKTFSGFKKLIDSSCQTMTGFFIMDYRKLDCYNEEDHAKIVNARVRAAIQVEYSSNEQEEIPVPTITASSSTGHIKQINTILDLPTSNYLNPSPELPNKLAGVRVKSHIKSLENPMRKSTPKYHTKSSSGFELPKQETYQNLPKTEYLNPGNFMTQINSPKNISGKKYSLGNSEENKNLHKNSSPYRLHKNETPRIKILNTKNAKSSKNIDPKLVTEINKNKEIDKKSELLKTQEIVKNQELLKTQQIMKNQELLKTQEIVKNQEILKTHQKIQIQEKIQTQEFTKNIENRSSKPFLSINRCTSSQILNRQTVFSPTFDENVNKRDCKKRRVTVTDIWNAASIIKRMPKTIRAKNLLKLANEIENFRLGKNMKISLPSLHSISKAKIIGCIQKPEICQNNNENLKILVKNNEENLRINGFNKKILLVQTPLLKEKISSAANTQRQFFIT